MNHIITTDPICGMSVPEDSIYSMDDCHRKILFCSKACMDQYLKRLPKNIDPVCGMRVDDRSPYKLEKSGQKLVFCSVDCRAVYQRRQSEGSDQSTNCIEL